jgi:hypothetical protein
MAYCSACGAPRLPLTGEAVELAGKGEQIGGFLAKVTGWAILAFGLGFTLLMTALFGALFGGGAAAFVGLPMALGVLGLFFLLRKGGSTLARQGDDAQRAARVRALSARAAHKGGVIRPSEAADLLRLTVDQADRILTDLAKTSPDLLTLEIDDAGGYYYRLGHVPGEPVRVRFEDVVRQRVDAREPLAASEGADEAEAARRRARGR